MIPLMTSSLTVKEVLSFPREDYISKLADLLGKTFDKSYIRFTSDARNAIRLALKIMKLSSEDEVITPAFTCDAVRVAVESVCKPVYVDIDRRTFNIDPTKIEASISSRTRAIIVVHLYGNPCQMDEIVSIAKARNLAIIEDVAQALGGRYRDRMLGSFGDFAVFSFRFSKDVTSLRGGALLTNEKISYLNSGSTAKVFPLLLLTLLSLKLIRLAPPFFYSKLRGDVLFPIFSQNASKFNDSNQTLSNYQCYLLFHQFLKMSSIIDKRRENAVYYSDNLKGIVAMPEETDKGKHTFFRYTIQTDERNELHDYLLKYGIEADKTFDHCIGNLVDCPEAQSASQRNLSIPVHHELSSKDLRKIVEAINEFEGLSRFPFGKHRRYG